jgi:death on curing protein
VRFAPDQAHATAMIMALAAGEVSEGSLARWIRDNWPKT